MGGICALAISFLIEKTLSPRRNVHLYYTPQGAEMPRISLIFILLFLAALYFRYWRLGFKELGIIPSGFRMPDGTFSDIVPQYLTLK